MNGAVLSAAIGLIALAAMLPFTALGPLAVIPVTGAIGGAVFLVWLLFRAPACRCEPPPDADLLEIGRR